MSSLIVQAQQYFWILGVFTLIVGAALLVHIAIFRLMARRARKEERRVYRSFVNYLKAPSRFLIPALLVRFSLPAYSEQLPPAFLSMLGVALNLFIIAVSAWLLIRLTAVLSEWLLIRYDIAVSDNLAARKVVTQMDIVRKILIFIVVLFALAIMLMSLEGFRQIGASLLASAGVAGLVIGFAAQRTIANVLAGFQIALAQPIRIDDVVIVENEWGRIEEITLTYVVVAIWDMRRLVLPISYFIEKPFQNWTRNNADILGTVFIYLDYKAPIGKIRAYLEEILKQSEFWDGKVWRLHTTDAGKYSVELRALMSAANSSDAWELRCEIREKLIEYIQENHPEALPRFRTEWEGLVDKGEITS